MLRKAINDIKVYGIGLGAHQTQAGLVCPFCDGGRDRERCFSITRAEDGAILYLCHRGSCNKRGRVSDHPSTAPKKPHLAIEPFDSPTTFLTDRQITFFDQRYGLTAKEIAYAGFLWATKQRKIVQPVYGPGKAFRGVVLRDYNIKEVKTHRNVLDEPWQSWYFCQNPKGIIIVEDQLSALKASRFYTAVALLNTTFTQDKVLEIKRVKDGQGVKKVVLMLDYDARNLALGLVSRWGSFIEGLSTELTVNQRDLKYWSDEELQEIIK